MPILSPVAPYEHRSSLYRPEPAANILVLGNDSRTRASYPSQREEGAQCTDTLLFKGLAEDRVGAYLTEHPSVVEMLPTAVN